MDGLFTKCVEKRWEIKDLADESKKKVQEGELNKAFDLLRESVNLFENFSKKTEDKNISPDYFSLLSHYIMEGFNYFNKEAKK